jgi:uncharacterized protein (TIGR02996 family)
MKNDPDRLAKFNHAMTLPRVRERLSDVERKRGGGIASLCALTSPGFEGKAEEGSKRPGLVFDDADEMLDRLAYADWADEVGLCARAWLVRDQISGDVPDLVIDRKLVDGPDGERASWMVYPFDVEAPADAYYWIPAALDAAAPLLNLPFVHQVIVRGGFPEMLTVGDFEGWLRYGPYAAASYPIWSVDVPAAAPLRTVMMERDDVNDESKEVEVFYWRKWDSGNDCPVWNGRLPEMLYDQVRVESGLSACGFSTRDLAMNAFRWGAARWAAKKASVWGLYPRAVGEGGESTWRRHASRPK